MKINIAELYKEVVDDIYEEFEKLLSEHGLKEVYFNVYNALGYVNLLIHHGMINYDKDEIKDHLSCLNAVNEITKNDDTNFKCLAMYTGNERPRPPLMIIASVEIIMEFILKNIDNLDMLKEYHKFIIRHEFGHVLDAINLNNLPYDEMIKVRTDRYKLIESMEKEFYEKRGLTEDEFHACVDNYDDDYMRFYLSLPFEKEAEELIGNDLEEHVKISSMVNRKKIIDISKMLDKRKTGNI